MPDSELFHVFTSQLRNMQVCSGLSRRTGLLNVRSIEAPFMCLPQLMFIGAVPFLRSARELTAHSVLDACAAIRDYNTPRFSAGCVPHSAVWGIPRSACIPRLLDAMHRPLTVVIVGRVVCAPESLVGDEPGPLTIEARDPVARHYFAEIRLLKGTFKSRGCRVPG